MSSLSSKFITRKQQTGRTPLSSIDKNENNRRFQNNKSSSFNTNKKAKGDSHRQSSSARKWFKPKSFNKYTLVTNTSDKPHDEINSTVVKRESNDIAKINLSNEVHSHVETRSQSQDMTRSRPKPNTMAATEANNFWSEDMESLLTLRIANPVYDSDDSDYDDNVDGINDIIENSSCITNESVLNFEDRLLSPLMANVELNH